MPSIAVDAGPLVALFKGADSYHADAVAFIQREERPLVTNLVVISEVVALIAPPFQTGFLTWASSALDIDHETATDLPRIIEIMNSTPTCPPISQTHRSLPGAGGAGSLRWRPWTSTSTSIAPPLAND